MEIKQITAWTCYNKNHSEWRFNHIEDGWSDNPSPINIPLTPPPKCVEWRKTHETMKNGQCCIIVEQDNGEARAELINESQRR